MSTSVVLINGRVEDLPHDVAWVAPSRPSLVIADPPDNLGLAYRGYSDRLPEHEYSALLERWLVLCCQATAGPVFFTFNERWTNDIEAAIYINDLKLVQRLYWRWTFGQNCKSRYTPAVRPVYWLNAPTIYPDAIKVPSARQTTYKDKRAKDGGRLPDNVWDFPRVCGTFKERRRWHVCQLPEALVERIILGHSKPGDTVLDPFIGSGTTAYVGQRLGRHVIGIDQSKEYLAQIDKELKRREFSKQNRKLSTSGE